MQKKSGFSILELLVVMGIVGLLAVISVPSFSRMQSRSNFQSEIETVFDQLLEARINALTGKMCNGFASINWTFTFGETTSTVSCAHSSGTVTTQTYETLWHLSQALELDDVSKTEIQIVFLPDTAQAFLPDGTSQRTDAKILLTHSSGDQQTICFNRIAGIPETSTGDTDCTP